MSQFLEIAVEGGLGVVALDRPAQINALDGEMIASAHAALQEWQRDDRVRAVLFEGRGARGFCAGGDVRAVRGLVAEGRRAEAEAFFSREYALNGLIATYGKPVVALTHGHVMGGGIGLAGHAQFRFAASDARFAMPEAGIGFVCDVGVNAILGKTQVQRALLFLLTGVPVGGADALALGLTDCVVPAGRLAEVRAGIVRAAGAGDVPTALVSLMQVEGIEAGEAEFCVLADGLHRAMQGGSAAEIVAAIDAEAREHSRLAALAEILRTRSPTSLEAILAAHRAARRLRSVHDVLALDARLAHWMIGQADFSEGVRAVLVDKDLAPRWSPARLEEVDHAGLAAAIGSLQPEPMSLQG